MKENSLLERERSDKLRRKEAALLEILRSFSRLAVAYSGGVDSTLLLAAANEVLGENVIAITASAPNFPREETEEAVDFCRSQKIQQLMAPLSEEDLEAVYKNSPDRCYHCKKAIFSKLLKIAAQNGASALADGTNADDSSDYRPGLRAIQELAVRSPLAEAGLTKQEIRALLQKRGISAWNKPAYACLATRIPTGEIITKEKLAAVELGEQALHQLGFLQVRVRCHGEVARIEAAEEDQLKFLNPELSRQVSQALKKCGFRYVALDLEGYQMGSMNSVPNHTESK